MRHFFILSVNFIQKPPNFAFFDQASVQLELYQIGTYFFQIFNLPNGIRKSFGNQVFFRNFWFFSTTSLSNLRSIETSGFARFFLQKRILLNFCKRNFMSWEKYQNWKFFTVLISVDKQLKLLVTFEMILPALVLQIQKVSNTFLQL